MICDISLQFWLLFKCFCQLSHMKTNRSTIPSPIAKPIKTFLDWVTTFRFTRFVYMQCKHHFSSYLFTLHIGNIKLSPYKSFSKKTNKPKKQQPHLTFLLFFCTTFWHRFTSDFLLFLAQLPPLSLQIQVESKSSKILQLPFLSHECHYEIYKKTMTLSLWT